MSNTYSSLPFRDPCIPDHSLAGAVISFGRVLKEHGFAVSPPSVMEALAGISCVGIEELRDFRTVLKSTFLTRVEESAIFDRLFDEFWMDRGVERGAMEQVDKERGSPDTVLESTGGDEGHVIAEAGFSDSQEQEARQARPYVVYSPHEVLRETDFRDVPEGEDRRMARLIREILAPLVRRLGIRKRPVPSGITLDFRRLLRRNLLYGGEIFELPRLKRKPRIKRLVFLCDVSGSMNPYLMFMLRFIKEIQELPTRVEVFVFATRLNRITPLLSRLPFPRAMQEVARTVRDWSGGTRIGQCLHEFTLYRGGGLLGPSTVVLIHSDGWDRGDPALLEKEMARIHRRSYRVLWINPLLGSASYEPTCKGMRAALPHLDSFLPGHNFAALERLTRALRCML